MKQQRRHASRRLRVSARVAISAVMALFVLGGGTAYAGYRYDAAAAERLLPGVRIDGVDVGEMTRAEAIEVLQQAAAPTLDREIEVDAAGESWHVTPRELGTRAKVAAAVDRALKQNRDFSWPERVYHRMLDRQVGASYELDYRYNQKKIRGFVGVVAESVNVSPSDASVEVRGGKLVVREPRKGRELRVEKARESVLDALREPGSSSVQLGLRSLKPEVTLEDLGYTIVVRLSELKLYLYDGVDLVRTYPVAAGQPAYPTPQGTWTVIDKAVNPTWRNPAPDGWGAGMPAVIPGGPSNPLGTRALYLDAPGIRIHGTADSGSIGTYASHGCIRMLRSDVEALYEIVPVGTPVHVVS